MFKALRIVWKAFRALAIFFFLVVGGLLFDLGAWAMILGQTEDGGILLVVSGVCCAILYGLTIYG